MDTEGKEQRDPEPDVDPPPAGELNFCSTEACYNSEILDMEIRAVLF